MRVLTDRFHVGQGTQIGPITAFPVWTEAKLSISYDTTPVATLQVSELENPTIENLNIASTHQLPVLLPEGTVLDPFAGPGSTGKAAVLDNYKFIGIEMNKEYVAIAKARIEHALSKK